MKKNLSRNCAFKRKKHKEQDCGELCECECHRKLSPDCYECKHRGEVVGSAHSSCNHPKCEQLKGSFVGLLSVLSGGHMPQVKTGLKVKGNEQGIRGGWFNHPLNFDPVWLEECDGFEKK